MAIIASSREAVERHVEALKCDAEIAPVTEIPLDNTSVAADTVASYTALSECMNQVIESVNADAVGVSHAAGLLENADEVAALLYG